MMILLLALSATAMMGQIPLDEAIKLYQDGQFQEAREKFLMLLKENPEGAEVLYYLGEIEPDADKSLEYRRQFLSLHPLHPLADKVLYGVAQYDFAMGYYLTAAKDYQRLLRNYPNSDMAAEAIYWLASSKLAIGAIDSASVYFHRLLDEYRQSTLVSWAEMGLVDVHFIGEEFSLALSQCLAFLETNANNELLPVALFRLAEIHQALEDIEMAKDVFQRLVGEYPDTYQGKQAQRRLTEWVKPEEEKEETQTEEGKFCVQVGAFSKRANAQNLQTKLRSWGYKVEVVKRSGRHRSFYLVWVGRYQSREEANQEAKILEKQRSLPYHIIKR